MVAAEQTQPNLVTVRRTRLHASSMRSSQVNLGNSLPRDLIYRMFWGCLTAWATPENGFQRESKKEKKNYQKHRMKNVNNSMNVLKMGIKHHTAEPPLDLMKNI